MGTPTFFLVAGHIKPDSMFSNGKLLPLREAGNCCLLNVKRYLFICNRRHLCCAKRTTILFHNGTLFTSPSVNKHALNCVTDPTIILLYLRKNTSRLADVSKLLV